MCGIDLRNPVGVVWSFDVLPRVARASQPWALLRNPVGIRGPRSTGMHQQNLQVPPRASDTSGFRHFPFHEVQSCSELSVETFFNVSAALELPSKYLWRLGNSTTAECASIYSVANPKKTSLTCPDWYKIYKK